MNRKRAVLLCVLMSVAPLGTYAVETPKAAPVADDTKTPVLFVHGRGLSSASFASMTKFLVKNGYPPSFLRAIDLVPNDGQNIPAAEKQIAPYVEKFLAAVNAELRERGSRAAVKTKVDIVAHSMGSMSSRWYIAKVRPDRVRTWVSLAGPNHGSDANCPGRPGSGKVEQCPSYAKSARQARLQYELNGGPGPDVDETPYGVGVDSDGVQRVPPDDARRILYVTVRTPNDAFIQPVDSTIVDGAGGVRFELPASLLVAETSSGNFVMTNGITHDELTYDPEAVRLVHQVLRIADAEPR